jgi:hypothetical protein
MREGVVVVVLAFTAMCTVGGFSEAAVLAFGTTCGVVGAGVLLRRSLVSVAGLFALGLLSPFALEYPAISDGFTLMAVTALVTFAVGGLVHVSLTADERRRFDWRVRGYAVLVTAAAGLIVVYSVVLLSGLGAVGTFLGDVEATGAQIIVLACATAIVFALLLVPSPDRNNTH